MKFSEFISADVCQVAVEQAPAHRATLYHRKRRVAEKRLHECSGLSWGTAETLSCVYTSNHAVACMGGFVLFLFFHCLLRKWRWHKGAYPNASRYALRASAVYIKISGKICKIWRRNKRALDRKVLRLKVSCLVLYYLIYGKLYRARIRFKKKITPLLHCVKSAYMKLIFSIIYHRLPPLKVSAVVIFLGLFMSGDVELNPGPKEGRFTINDLKFVRSAIWEARPQWMDIGIELNLNKSDLDALKETDGGNVGTCLTEMITLWLKKVDPPPTLSALIIALKEPTIGLQELADRVNKQWSESCAAKSAFSTDTEIDQLSFPHISKVAPDKETRQLLEGRLREESLDIIQDFQVVINKFFDTLEDRDYSVKRLKRYLEGAFKDKQEQLVTMEDIQTFIRWKSSFYDYRLVKYMINSAGTAEDKTRLRKYEQEFLCYAKRRIYECPSKFTNVCSPEDVKLYIKLDSEYDECKLEELQGFQYRLSSVLHINVYYCLLREIKEGCFKLTFLIPQQVQEETFPLSTEQLIELEKLKVLYIACGDYTWCIAPKPPELILSDDDDDLSDAHPICESLAPSVSSLNFDPLPRRMTLRSRRRRHTGRSDTSSCATGCSSGPASFGSSRVYETSQYLDQDYSINLGDSALREMFNLKSTKKELYVAASSGDLAKVKSLIDKYNNYCVCTDDNGNAALHHAAMGGHLNVVQYLSTIEQVNPASPGKDGMTPLHFASLYGHLDIVTFLIDKQLVDPQCYNNKLLFSWLVNVATWKLQKLF